MFVNSYNETGYREKLPGNGAFVSATYSLPIGSGTFVTTGLRLDYVGSKDNGIATVLKDNWLFAGIPLMLTNQHSIGSEMALGASLGPTFTFGLLGKQQVFLNGNKVGEPIDLYEIDGIKRFDILVGANIYLELFSQLRINVGYDVGLLNTSGYDSFKRRIQRLNVGLSYVIF